MDVGTRTETGTVEELYRRELTRLVRLAYLLTSDASFAEEAAQEAFARLLPRFDGVREPAAFLTTSTVNLCRDRYRRADTVRRNPPAPPSVAEPPELPRDVDVLWGAVQSLAEAAREVVVLRFWCDLETTEIARLLGKRPGTVRSLLHRALATLQEGTTDER